jgi:hypothetical protein
VRIPESPELDKGISNAGKQLDLVGMAEVSGVFNQGAVAVKEYGFVWHCYPQSFPILFPAESLFDQVADYVVGQLVNFLAPGR